MGLFTQVLGLFDKVDDIVYEPVKAISEWAKEPLKRFQHNREMKDQKLQQQLAQEDREHIADLEISLRKRHVEIDQMIAEYNDIHAEKMVEALKNYQLTLANASAEIVENIGRMSNELRAMASERVEETRKKLLEEIEMINEKSNKQLKKAKEDFGEDSDIFKKKLDVIISQEINLVEIAEGFISDLRDDLKKEIALLDDMTKEHDKKIAEALSPIGNVIGQSNICIDANNPTLENKQGFLAKSN